MRKPSWRGVLRKMKVTLADPVQYQLPLGEQPFAQYFAIDQRLGQRLAISFTGNIFCIACGRKTKRSFAQGHCFPCFKSLAACDLCIVRPHTCHYHLGTCRDEAWAARHCMQPHYVYIANSSALKVGITRATQIPTRWIDQGASQAVVVFQVQSRLHAGLLENEIKKYVSERTNWRKMLALAGGAPTVDLRAAVRRIIGQAKPDLARLQDAHPDLKWEPLNQPPLRLRYPFALAQAPSVVSLNLDKTADIAGRLDGIKGQYLIFDCGVLNIRKFSGYEVAVA